MRCSPFSDEVQLWIVSLDSIGDLDSLAKVLSGDELARADRIPDARVRRRYVAARVALRRLLGERLAQAPADLRFAYGENGKPKLMGGGASFNLSHSGELGLIAIADRGAIGVDIERLRPRSRLDLLARRVLTSAERDLMAQARAAGGDQRWFMRWWTAKEAVAKSFGWGLALAPSRIEVLPEGSDRGVAQVIPAAGGPLPDGAGPIRVEWPPGLENAVAAVAGSGVDWELCAWRRLSLD
jgi:4'-phosphopantetheinyl transferase